MNKSAWSFGIVRSCWLPLLLFVGVLTLYLLTLSPGALGGDAGELQFVPAILGLPHPTGTPLYILLGKVWSLLPLGPNVAWRMNLLAAVSAALAAVLVYQTVFMLTRRAVPALAAALSLALGLTFWEQAVLADKYAFNALMVALVVYLTLRWGQTRSPITLNGLALVYGLSLTHHRSMILLALPLLGYVWQRERAALWRDRRRLLRLAALCILPLLLYLYLFWAEGRGLPPGTWRPQTARQWYDYLFDTGRTGLVYVDMTDLADMLLFYARTLLRDFGWPGVLLGLGGLAWQGRRRPADALFLLVNYVLQAFLAANHHVPRHWVYFIPSFLIWALWIGEAWGGIGLGIEQVNMSSLARKLVWAGLALMMLIVPFLSFAERYRPLRQSHLGWGTLDAWRQTLKTGHMADRIGQAIVEVEPGAVILCDWEQATPLWYYQQVEGLRPDVQMVYPIERLDEAAAWGRPLYLARTLPGVAERWHPSGSGALIALRDEPLWSLPPQVVPLSLRYADDAGDVIIELAGFRYGGEAFRPPQVAPLTLYWRAVAAPEYDYSVSVRLLNPAGETVFAVDSQHPVLGMYPTSGWQPGEIVADYYEIQLPPHLPAGRYRWGAILYRTLPQGGWPSLTVADTNESLGIGGELDVR